MEIYYSSPPEGSYCTVCTLSKSLQEKLRIRGLRDGSQRLEGAFGTHQKYRKGANALPRAMFNCISCNLPSS